MSHKNIRMLIVGAISNSQAIYDDGVRERFGGGAIYGSQTSVKLGVDTSLLTLGANDIDAGVKELESLGVKVIKSDRKKSNNFSNDYRGKRKLQMRSVIERPLEISDILAQNTS